MPNPLLQNQANNQAAAESNQPIKHRPLYDIAREIRQHWPMPYFGVRPYLTALLSLDQISDTYGQDSALSIVRYLLSNASTWRGPEARRIKAELNTIVRVYRKAHPQAY